MGSDRKPDLTVLIPTKNEADSISQVIGEVSGVCAKLSIDYSVLVVDGHSTDETVERARESGADVLLQKGPGYSGAILEGFQAAEGEFILTCDADGSHSGTVLENLWKEHDKADLVIASRFVPGGGADMSTWRYVLSRILNQIFSTLLRVPVRDMSSGYRLHRKEALERFEFKGGNLSVLQDIVSKLHMREFRIIEVPFFYQPRRAGSSKSKVLKFGFSYLGTLFRLLRFKYLGSD